MDPLDSPSKVTCSMCKPHEFNLLATAIHASKVLPRPSFEQGGTWLKMAENGGLWLSQMEETQRSDMLHWTVHEK